MNNIIAGTAATVVAVRRFQLMRSDAFSPKRWSDRKRELVRDSWHALQLQISDAKAEQVGIDLFKRFFQRHPAFLQLFTFRDQPSATFFMNAQVRLHVGIVIATLSHMVDQLDDLEALKKVCGKLGQRHKKYHVKKGHFKAMGEALLHTLAAKLGEDGFDAETKQAWEEILKLIFSSMMKGTPDEE